MKHLTQQPEVDALPEPFGEVIRRALAKDPKDRYQTVEEMTETLLGVDAIQQSVAGFDPTSVSGVARQAVGDYVNSPAPSPNPPPPAPAYARVANGQAGVGVAAMPVAVPVGLGRPAVAAPFAVAQAAPAEQLSPEAASGRLYYAGFWIRLVAALIDSIAVTAGFALVATVLHAPAQDNPLWLALAIIYDGLLIGRWNGQTLGKKTCGIKVISADGRPCGQWQAYGRALASVLNWFTLGLSYLIVAFSNNKRGLHDHIAGTLHVYAMR